jgi:trehalose 6-phosphate synthase/phosphatase
MINELMPSSNSQEYLALLSVADLALVTSMRDGMNTTSMEYVLCQKDKKSPLILSEFTGVTGSMKAAVRINPWDSMGVARAIDSCLQMDSEERAQRHAVSSVASNIASEKQ